MVQQVVDLPLRPAARVQALSSTRCQKRTDTLMLSSNFYTPHKLFFFHEGCRDGLVGKELAGPSWDLSLDPRTHIKARSSSIYVIIQDCRDRDRLIWGWQPACPGDKAPASLRETILKYKADSVKGRHLSSTSCLCMQAQTPVHT